MSADLQMNCSATGYGQIDSNNPDGRSRASGKLTKDTCRDSFADTNIESFFSISGYFVRMIFQI